MSTCNCVNCKQARFAAALLILAVEAPSEKVRECAALLLTEWAGMVEAGRERPTTPLESLAIDVCADWITDHPQQLRALARDVAVSGYIDVEGGAA